MKMSQKEQKISVKIKKSKSKKIKSVPKKTEKKFDSQKTIKNLAIIISAFLLGFSVFYYYVLFLPSIEKQRLEQQKMLQELYLTNEKTKEENKPSLNLEEDRTEQLSEGLLPLNCLDIAKETYLEVFEAGIELCNKKANEKEKSDCASSLIAEIEKGLKEAEKECLSASQEDKSGLEVMIP